MRLPNNFGPEERIEVFRGDQADPLFLSGVANKTAPDGFDIIVDDASHLGESTRRAFWHLFDNHLKPGGLYVIEDLGTGYWGDWPDGKTVRPKSAFLSRMWNRALMRSRIARKLPVKIPFDCHA